MKRSTNRNAFTLIEVLIVVIIMAVLAATIIPQFSQSTDDAKTSSVDFNLHTMQTQIEMYRFQHNGSWPTFADFVDQMTGTTSITGDTSGTEFGPYMQEIPANPYNNQNGVTAGTGAAFIDDDTGWQYDANTGRIYANHAEAFGG